MVLQDLLVGTGVALLDPHGDLAQRIHSFASRLGRNVVLLDPVRAPGSFGLNPLRPVAAPLRPLAASGLLEVLRKLWDEKAWGPRMEHILRNAILALLDHGDATIADIPRLFRDRSFRNSVARGCQNPEVRTFWLEEFSGYSHRMRAEAVAPILNKVGAFLSDPRVLQVLTKNKNQLSLRRTMDEGKVLIANLSKGELGSDSSNLLGGLLVSTIGLAALSRASIPEEERRPFFVYVDEFQSFSTRSIGDMAAELRKYRVGLVLAHQFLHQLDPEVRYSVLGNAGTIISFRVGPQDASLIASEFDPVLSAMNVLNLPNYHIYLKLMIDGAPSRPFSAVTLQPEEALRLGQKQRVRELSRHLVL